MPRPADVLVFGSPEDPHALRVADAVAARGAGVVLIDFAPFPATLPLSLEEGVPRWQGEDLRHARSAYVRSIHMRLPFFEVELAARAGAGAAELLAEWKKAYAAERDRQSFLTSFMLSLERAGVRVVNPTATLDQHFAKLDQLAILRAAGVPVPRTLGTNDPEAASEFIEAVGRAVVKPAAGGDLCRRLRLEDVAAGAPVARGLGERPAILQEEAPGKNVRVYVVGGKPVATFVIESDELDYRGSEKSVKRIEPMKEVDQVCVKAAEACGMLFTGIDLRLEDEKRFVVLECNPSPMFEGFELAAKERLITEALAEYLLRRETGA